MWLGSGDWVWSEGGRTLAPFIFLRAQTLPVSQCCHSQVFLPSLQSTGRCQEDSVGERLWESLPVTHTTSAYSINARDAWKGGQAGCPGQSLVVFCPQGNSSREQGGQGWHHPGNDFGQEYRFQRQAAWVSSWLRHLPAGAPGLVAWPMTHSFQL